MLSKSWLVMASTHELMMKPLTSFLKSLRRRVTDFVQTDCTIEILPYRPLPALQGVKRASGYAKGAEKSPASSPWKQRG
jgi:hypothetical protein